MNFNVLYKKNKDNSLQMWKIWTRDSVIHTEFGKMDGKIQSNQKIIKGKSIGRSNETTPTKQAELDAQSMWNKKKDKGYFLTTKEAEEEIVFLPMLAHDMLKMTETKVKALFKNPLLYLQPKMDGVRCLARWNGDKIQLLSRGGKEYTIPHLSTQLEAVIKPGQVLDGEVYIHGLLRQDINALVKKHREKEYEDTGYRSADLEYWVYDTFRMDDLNQPFYKRITDLNELSVNNKTIRIVKTDEFLTSDTFITAHEDYVKRGFEGTIIRVAEGKYELAHRSRDLIKYKDFEDDEFEIIGFKEGTGKFTSCVIWNCNLKNGKTFDVVPKGTLKQKKQWFSKAEKYMGKYITVKYQGLSKDGIPEFPVGLGLRLDGDI